MIDHGALETNYGRKKIVGPDRHQQRKREELEASLETAQQRVGNKGEALHEQQAKVAESKAKGHGKRLEQRQQALLRAAQALEEVQRQQAMWVAQVEALGAGLSTSSLLDEQPERRHMTVILVSGACRQFL